MKPRKGLMYLIDELTLLKEQHDILYEGIIKGHYMGRPTKKINKLEIITARMEIIQSFAENFLENIEAN